MNLNLSLKKAACLLVPISIAAVVAACGGGSSGTTTTTTTSTSYSGPGSKWDVTLSSDNSFNITKRASVGADIDFTVTGSYESLDTGFLKLTVGGVTGTGGPTAGDIAYALDIPGYAFFLKPLDAGSNQVISMVKGGTCPTSDVLANWVMVKSDGDPTDAGRDFFGTFSYNTTTQVPDLPSKYNLSNFTTVAGGGIGGTGTCSDGILSVTGADMFLTDNGGAIVHIDSGVQDDTADDQFVFGLGAKEIGATSTDGDYAGLLFDASQSSGAQISPVALTCASNECTATVLSNVETGATESGSAIAKLTSFDSPSIGFATGTVEEGGNPGANGKLACMIDVNAVSTGKKIMSCVGQSPGDNTKMFNVLFVSKS